MTISTYSGLVSAATEWLARDEDATLIARIPDFITLAEAKMNRTLRVRQLEQRSTTTIDTSTGEPEFISLPDDFLVMRRIRLSSVAGKPKLDFMSGSQLDEYRYGVQNVTGQPQFFTIIGAELELSPTPDQNYTVEMVYRTTISPINSSNTTSSLLTLAPDLYLYGTLLEASPYIQNDERIQVWGAAFTQAINDLNQLSIDSTYGNTPLEIRTTGAVF